MRHVIRRRVEPEQSAIRVLDLFCGIGGFSHGFEQAGQFRVTGGIDLLPDRITTFSANHPTATAICGDIRNITIGDLAQAEPSPHVIIGGPPCQGFSSIRPFRTLTEKDPRNNLFEHFVLVVEALRPQWFVLENVVGLLTHKSGKTLHSIVTLFRDIGYTTEWRILNAALFGLPQRRERFILVGNSRGARFNWPSPTHHYRGRSMAGKQRGHSVESLPLFNGLLPPAVTVMEAIHDLPEVEAGQAATYYREDISMTEYERSMRGTETLLTLHEATHHSSRMLDIIRMSGYNRNALPDGLVSSGFSSSYSRLEPDLPSVTLTVNFVHPASNKCIHPHQNRALTPREGARLQGFEDSYVFIGNRAQIVKQIGNAVPPMLGRIIASALKEQF
ncbi:MAG: DNA cytosine methyltransferase [Anaerolineae bacterium]